MVLTAPIAIIRNSDGTAVGKMKNVRVTENIRRGKVTGIGAFKASERPAIEWEGSLTCSFYMVNLQTTGFLGNLRDANRVKTFIDNLLLNEEGFDVHMYKKAPKEIDANTGLINETQEEPIAIIRGLLLERDGFDITEGGISGRDQSFVYLDPVGVETT